MPAHGGNLNREPHPQSPAGNIDFVYGLIADVTVAGIPDPMPVVVKSIAGEGLHRCGTGPQVVVDPGRHRFRLRMSNAGPPFVAECAGQIGIAYGAVVYPLDGFDHAGIGARLAPMLAYSVVLLHRPHQLTPFKPVVRAGLLHVNIFAGLAGPDRHQRVPVIGRGDGNGVNIFVLKQPSNVAVRFGPCQPHLFRVTETLVQYAFVDIAHASDFGPRNVGEALEMIVAAAPESTNCQPHPVIGPKYCASQGKGSCAHGHGSSCRFEKIASINFHSAAFVQG